jgi:uncharacterized protein (DUF2342 family)
MMSAQMIDWNVAVQTGTRLVRPGPQVSHEEAREVVEELRSLAKLAEGHVRDFTGIEAIGSESQQATIVDRPGWIKANIDGFSVVQEPLIDPLKESRARKGGIGGP